jgi:hypothetical protein
MMKDTVEYIMLNRPTQHWDTGRTRPQGTAGRLGHRVDASPGEGLRDWQGAGWARVAQVHGRRQGAMTTMRLKSLTDS